MKYWVLMHKRSGRMVTESDFFDDWELEAPPMLYLSRNEARVDRGELSDPENWTTGTVKMKPKKAR